MAWGLWLIGIHRIEGLYPVYLVGMLAHVAYCWRLSEAKNKERYQELPLCQIRELYKNLPNVEAFIKELTTSAAPSPS